MDWIWSWLSRSEADHLGILGRLVTVAAVVFVVALLVCGVFAWASRNWSDAPRSVRFVVTSFDKLVIASTFLIVVLTCGVRASVIEAVRDHPCRELTQSGRETNGCCRDMGSLACATTATLTAGLTSRGLDELGLEPAADKVLEEAARSWAYDPPLERLFAVIAASLLLVSAALLGIGSRVIEHGEEERWRRLLTLSVCVALLLVCVQGLSVEAIAAAAHEGPPSLPATSRQSEDLQKLVEKLTDERKPAVPPECQACASVTGEIREEVTRILDERFKNVDVKAGGMNREQIIQLLDERIRNARTKPDGMTREQVVQLLDERIRNAGAKPVGMTREQVVQLINERLKNVATTGGQSGTTGRVVPIAGPG
jgi:hypothetical protein